jgi:hypothetical protein
MDTKAQLDRYFAMFEQLLPLRAARFARWVRQPSSFYGRVPLATALVVGGIFSFLPVLGLWMLPLGLMLIAQDIPFLRAPLVVLFGLIERKWIARQRATANGRSLDRQRGGDSFLP